MESWPTVRRAFLEGFRPAALDTLTGQAGRAANSLWAELCMVKDVPAWRMTTATSGQLLELLLKQAVLIRGGDRRVARLPLGPVLKAAEEMGIFAPPGDAITVANTRYAAKELRNIASHGSPWQEDDTERRATYSLTYLVCFAGYLFPRGERIPEVSGDRRPEDITAETDDAPGPGGEVGRCLSHLDDAELADRVRRCSPRAFLRVAQANRGETARLKQALTASFGHVIENSGYGRVRSLYDLARWCQSQGLTAHARCCGILLPHDADALEWLGQGSALRYSKYLFECRRAEPRLYERSFNRNAAEAVQGVVAGWLDDPGVNTAVIANMLENLPTGAVLRFVENHRHAVARRIRGANAPTGVAWLRTLHRTRGLRKGTSQLVVDSLLSALAEDDDATAGAVPLRLSQLAVIEHDEAAPVVEALLARVAGGMDAYHGSRVLWDLYALSQRYADRAVALAARSFQGVRARERPWVALLWGSVLAAADPSADLLPQAGDLAVEWPEGRQDYVQQLRVGYTLAVADVPLPPSRVRHLASLAQDFRAAEDPSAANGARFIEACRGIFPLSTA